MKKIISFIIVCIMILTQISFAAQRPSVSARAAIVMDTVTGRVLYSKNINQKLSMASTTKIMTAITAIENGNIDDIIRTSRKASHVEGSSIWLEENEKITLENALYGLLLSSGNDAAIAIAEHVGGSVDKFADMMNAKAKEIGAVNSSFKNPHGLTQEGHYTTAYDLALIMRYGLRNPLFREISKTRTKKIPWEGHKWKRVLKNHNKLLWRYEYSDGGKTGFTKKAGRCLVSSATKNGWQLVAVTLNDGDDWNDHMNMLNYAFDTYKLKTVLNKGQFIKTIKVTNGKNKGKVSLISNENLSIPIINNEKNEIKIKYNGPDYIKAPVIQYQNVGKAEVYLDGKLISSIDLSPVEYIRGKNIGEELSKVLKNWMYIFNINNQPMV